MLEEGEGRVVVPVVRPIDDLLRAFPVVRRGRGKSGRGKRSWGGRREDRAVARGVLLGANGERGPGVIPRYDVGGASGMEAITGPAGAGAYITCRAPKGRNAGPVEGYIPRRGG